jgi:hypothetical protein
MSMKQLKNRFGLFGLVLIGAMITGCLLVSGTFVIVENIDFSSGTNFYFYAVDVTSNSDWQDHKDNIDFIDAVGFELYGTNGTGSAVACNAYVDDYTGGAVPGSVPASATNVLNNLTIPAGAFHVTYAQSMASLANLTTLKSVAKTGKFDFYATVGEAPIGSINFHFDSAKVIITVSGSK